MRLAGVRAVDPAQSRGPFRRCSLIVMHCTRSVGTSRFSAWQVLGAGRAAWVIRIPPRALGRVRLRSGSGLPAGPLAPVNKARTLSLRSAGTGWRGNRKLRAAIHAENPGTVPGLTLVLSRRLSWGARVPAMVGPTPDSDRDAARCHSLVCCLRSAPCEISATVSQRERRTSGSGVVTGNAHGFPER
jgi:hypothetical protein